jgi:hypothetical protein
MSGSDEEVSETLEFFAFSHRQEADYSGKVAFVISQGDDKAELAHTVVVGGDTVDIRKGVADDATVVRMDRDTFLDVYSGYRCRSCSPALDRLMSSLRSLNPRNAILSGKIGVDGMRFMEVKRFCSSFDFSTRKWNEFYKERERASFLSSRYDSVQFWKGWKSVCVRLPRPGSVRSTDIFSRFLLPIALLRVARCIFLVEY